MSNETQKISELLNTSIVSENTILPVVAAEGETNSIDIITLRSALLFDKAFETNEAGNAATSKNDSYFVYTDATKTAVLGWMNQGGDSYSPLLDINGAQIRFIAGQTIRGLDYFTNGVNSFADLRTLTPLYSGQRIKLKAWAAGEKTGGGEFIAVFGTAMDDAGTIAAGTGFYWERVVDESVTPEMFGAKGDGIADDSDALQAAMNSCVDFVWQGNVGDTDDHGTKINHALLLKGQYRFTRTMIIPPYLKMTAVAQSYLADPKNNIVKFIPDFTLQDGYAFESLNLDSTGTHTAKVDTYSASASDNRLLTRCPGLLLENFSVIAGANTLLKGIFNFRLTHGAVLQRVCARITSKAAVGANLTCTWNGSFRDCIFRTATLALTLKNNVTTWLFDNCYFQTTQGNNPLTWFTDFPEFYGYTTRQTWTACVAATWSSPHFKDCTLENAQNGYRFHRCQGGSEHGTYFENIEEECYALMESVLSMTPGYFYNNKGTANTTRMVFLSGSPNNSASIDMTNTNYFSQTVDPYDCPGSSKLVVTHAANMRTKMKIKYPNKVIFNCHSQFPGYCDIYVSASGNDDWNGYSSTYPVQTLQEAILRCQPHLKNRIYFTAGESIGTTKYYSDGKQPNRTFFEGYDIEFIGDSTNKPTLTIGEDAGWLFGVAIIDSHVRVSDLKIVLTLTSGSSAAATAFGAMFFTNGDCSVSFTNCDLSGANSTNLPYVVSPAQGVGSTRLAFMQCTFKDIRMIQGSGVSGLYLTYILNHTGCTFTNTGEGTTGGKIFSRALS